MVRHEMTEDEKMRNEARQVVEKLLNEYWARVVPKAIPPVSGDGVIHQRNYTALAVALNTETVLGKGKRPVRHDTLADIVTALDRQGALEHYPEVVEKIVQVEKKVPLNRKEAHKLAADLTREMNRPGRSPIQGFGPVKDDEPQPPRASQAQLEAQARNDLHENEVMGDVRSLIGMHRNSGSHSATRYEREILTNVMEQGIERGDAADKILEQVQAQQSAMTKWGPQDALKQLRPELFQTKKEQW